MYRVKIVANNLLLMLRFVIGGAGKSHGIGPLQRLQLLYAIRRALAAIESLSTWRQHLILAEDILSTPKEVEGDVVECGCFSGGSTACLSLACAVTGRRLFVCDSFEGLPKPRDEEVEETPSEMNHWWSYQEGDMSSGGGVEGVKANVARYGDVKCCTFVKGFFADTLHSLDTQSIILIFEDADLRSSTEDCVRALWPKLQSGYKFYSHEPFSTQVVSLFYDEAWWTRNLCTKAPGFVGSGNGIIEVLVPSLLGYSRKLAPQPMMVKQGRQRLSNFPTKSVTRD